MDVKICGVRAPAQGAACARAGATFAGLNFVPGRRRAVTVDEAEAILPSLGGVEPVGVFLDQPLARVLAVARALGLGWVQLHGAEPPEYCGALQREGLRVIKAVGVGAGFDPAELRSYRQCDRLLLDAPRPGSGERFDPQRVAGLEQPFILAGGLTPENVARAIAEVRPDGVDTASGVEVEGVPDPARIEAFVSNAKEAR